MKNWAEFSENPKFVQISRNFLTFSVGRIESRISNVSGISVSGILIVTAFLFFSLQLAMTLAREEETGVGEWDQQIGDAAGLTE